MDRSPMERVRKPRVGKTLVPIMSDDDTHKLLQDCKTHTGIKSRGSSPAPVLLDADFSDLARVTLTEV